MFLYTVDPFWRNVDYMDAYSHKVRENITGDLQQEWELEWPLFNIFSNDFDMLRKFSEDSRLRGTVNKEEDRNIT